jgi:predicted metal-dependent phosphoesterase TrpH
MTKRVQKADFHLHSRFSNGDLTPRELVIACKGAGLDAIALTDHECIEGIPELLAAADEFWIRAVAGIEIGAEYNQIEHHFLGLGIDIKNTALLSFLEKRRQEEHAAHHEEISKLRSLGFSIDLKHLQTNAAGISTRWHICTAIFKNPENDELLKKIGVNSPWEFFKKFLGPDAPAHSKIVLPRAEEIVTILKEAGGVTIWAHPFWRNQNFQSIRQTADHFKQMGLDGIEVFYPFHNKRMTTILHQLAGKLNLLESAGSDFHSFSPERNNRIFSWNAYNFTVGFRTLLKRARLFGEN